MRGGFLIGPPLDLDLEGVWLLWKFVDRFLLLTDQSEEKDGARNPKVGQRNGTPCTQNKKNCYFLFGKLRFSTNFGMNLDRF